MGRLIDVDEVKIAIYHAFAPYQREWAETLLKVNNAIDSTKTAYDPEAVVQQLKQNHVVIIDDYTEEYEDVVFLEEAIDIVRNGGVK